MACISKLAGGFAYDCDTGATGLESALIINKADIVSFATLPASQVVNNLTLAPGAKVFKIDTPKRVLVVSERLKINEGAPNAYTHSATLVATGVTDFNLRLVASAITNGSFVIITKDTRGFCKVYGLYYGLSATSAERSSADNGGWLTITLETPEQFIGEASLGFPADGITGYAVLYGSAVY